MWGKLPFADGMLYDFDTDTLRPGLPNDRLYNHTARPFTEWDAPNELQAIVNEFTVKLRDFTMDGGGRRRERVGEETS